ncbi:lysosomal alpha-mannosidase-like, partial [Cyanistes caeruleus]|uniref:lysosomal alpha-mannosidase-like n=1 Tax=Cyanistes caeruleus TaxID=156563 RepID=UPI000CDA9403
DGWSWSGGAGGGDPECFWGDPGVTLSVFGVLCPPGRLELVGGGWCMNDEAAAHYGGVLEQLGLGRRFLRRLFGRCGTPRVAWQIDPFGHSREMAATFAQMGYDGLFWGVSGWFWVVFGVFWGPPDPLSPQMGYDRLFLGCFGVGFGVFWGPPDPLSPQMGYDGLFLGCFWGILPNMYNPPPGLCWDQLCSDPPVVDGDGPERNVDSVVTSFLRAAATQAQQYRTRHILMTMGSDFHYENAHLWFKNLDKLIAHANAR